MKADSLLEPLFLSLPVGQAAGHEDESLGAVAGELSGGTAKSGNESRDQAVRELTWLNSTEWFQC